MSTFAMAFVAGTLGTAFITILFLFLGTFSPENFLLGTMGSFAGAYITAEITRGF